MPQLELSNKKEKRKKNAYLGVRHFFSSKLAESKQASKVQAPERAMS